VRVTSLSPDGIARIEGSKKVTVDGRLQEISLQGYVRPQDVSSPNIVLSSRIAEAVIDYKGKKIGPRTGIVGKILSILWP
jgi:flagellar L-ring protein precursor FlgH